MTGDLFGEWIRNLDSSFRAQDRKVVLLIDNCTAHPEIQNLTNINLIFLPPNRTSVLQPMDHLFALKKGCNFLSCYGGTLFRLRLSLGLSNCG